jgi:hypothetical protein
MNIERLFVVGQKLSKIIQKFLLLRLVRPS